MKIAGLYFHGDTVNATLADRRFSSSKKILDERVSLLEEHAGREIVLCGHLERWKKEDGVKGVVVGLGFRHFSYNFVELPLASKDDIRSALDYELEKYLPLSPVEYYHDFHTLEKDDSRTRCLVLSIRKDRLAWILRCLERTGLRLMGIRCTCVEAANEVAGQGKDVNAVVLSRDGGRYAAFGIRGSALLKVAVIPKGENLSAATDRLSLETAGEVFIWAPDEKHEESLPEGVHLHTTPASDLLALSTGLNGAVVDMDFSPGGQVSARKDRVSMALAGMALASIVLLFLSMGISYYKDSAALSEVRQRLDSIHGSAAQAVETRREIERLREKRDYLLKFQKRRNRDTEALRRLSATLPDGTWLTGFYSRSGGRVEIEGYSRRSAKLVGLIEKSGDFSEVAFTSPVTIKDGLERFSICMKVGG